ncbi:hypothetical protein IC614_04685 [Allosphingosinicella flava]|uniref:Glycine zipper domain-containing protein n=1 Tax=Allosphingosinicella flava TaxID=2771430 RepID=A0A7T2LMT3_9SPHN|nr:hypothetical protein [Sphingosinicella flava]QPQ55886.1 hypothetical protein IC614_04685 [Sphingosinicella flava]
MRKIGLMAAMFAASTLGACATDTDPALRGGATGAAIGAAVGAGVGAAVDGVSVEEGVAAGAVGGAIVGAVSSSQRRYAWDYDGRCYYVDGNGYRQYVDPDRCR